MDPTAFFLMIKAAFEFGTEIARGQTPEQKEKVWNWIVTDVEKIRADGEKFREFFKIGKP